MARPDARDALVDGLARLKFELSCDEVSGAWLGARLWYRQTRRRSGSIPVLADWTKVLCDGMARLLEGAGRDGGAQCRGRPARHR